MEWVENEEQNNDRCSTASSISNSGENIVAQTPHSNGLNPAKSQSANGNHSLQLNGGNTSVNLDSMSDGELSDFSLNDSDDDEFHSSTTTGK